MNRDIDLAFIRIHILYHATEGEVYGLGLIKELAHHGYKLGPGTLYPILARMKQQGLLISEKRTVDHKQRKYYRSTAAGRDFLADTQLKVKELYNEVVS